jgi:ABC transport system ATP-binding/permease protein
MFLQFQYSHCVKSKIALFIGGETHLLDSSQNYVIGRGKNSDVVVTNNLVSRSHCRVFFDNKDWILEDLGSSRGTFVEGKKIEKILLNGEVNGSLGGENSVIFEIKILQSQSESKESYSKLNVNSNDYGSSNGRIPLLNRMRIGKNQENNWVISQVEVSDFHAEINMVSPGNYEISDMNSKTGTLVNGAKVKRIKLRPGDEIRIGRVTRIFTHDGLETAEGTQGARVSLQDLYYSTESGIWLLKNINLNFAAATLTAVVGPSGAGKSTLMDVLTGRKKATSGKLTISDSTNLQKELHTEVGFVPQADILHTKLTVRQALTFGAQLRLPSGTSKEAISNRVQEVLELVELIERADLRIDKLSGGQRKRCSIALELLARPKVLILDEPTSGLDPGLDLHMMELMRSLANAGQTVIVVTHAVDNVGICDNLVLLRTGGTLAYAGPPSTVNSVMKHDAWADIFRDLAKTDNDVLLPSINSTILNSDESIYTSPQNFLAQFVTLSKRYIRIILSDRFYAGLLLLLPIVLGLIGYSVGNEAGLSPLKHDGLLVPNPSARLIVLILILGSVFISLSTSIQEIVKENPIIARERRLGVRWSTYILSKLVVLGSICFFQIGIFYQLTLLNRSSGIDALTKMGNNWELQISCLLLGLVAMGIGLGISSILGSAEQAMPSLVLLTMFQVIISGALPIRLDFLTNSVGVINPAYWAMNSLAASTNMNFLVGEQGSGSVTRWNHTTQNYYSSLLILTIFATLSLLFLFASLSRRDRISE